MARRNDNAGLDDMYAVERMLYGNVEDDPDLEAELLALQGEVDDDDDGDEVPVRSAATNARNRSRPQRTSLEDIDRLARQVSLEIPVADDENDTSVDDDDDLLAELNNVLSIDIAPPVPRRPSPAPPGTTVQKSVPSVSSGSTPSGNLVQFLSERLENYKSAMQTAKQEGDAAKVRRLDRGTKTLVDQLKLAKSGKSVNFEEIPPAIPVKSSKPLENFKPPLSPSTPDLSKPTTADISPPKLPKLEMPAVTEKPSTSTNLKSRTDDATMKMLLNRQEEYKKAALHAKQLDDKVSALKYFKICKQFDQVLEAMQNGQPVDLSNIPPSPGLTAPSQQQMFAKKETAPTVQKNSAAADDDDDLSGIVTDPKAVAELCHAPPPPSTIMEALQQRLDKYKSTADKAKAEGDTSKARRMGRIQKQYEDAIKDYKAKKPVNFEELPVPPGFGPIPGVGGGGGEAPAARPLAVPAQVENPQRMSMPATTTGVAGAAAAAGVRRSSAEIPKGTTATSNKQSRQEQQLKFLLERQHQFKLAALTAKKRGDITAAKNYLRQAMGFDQMIDASRNGLPIDISNVPTPPQTKTVASSLKPAVVPRAEINAAAVAPGAKEGSVLVGNSREETYANLEHDMIRQVQICDQNKEYFTKLGDVANVTTYEKSGMMCKKDLESLRNGFRHGDPPPRFHYESRTFPSLQCCPDLGSDDLELNIVRGLLLKLPSGYEPKDADIYVKYDFGFPKETPQSGKSVSVKGTNSPTFNHAIKLKISVKSRHFLLYVKRHGIKFEVYQKGSLFRSDRLLGTAEIKLLGLESKTEVHESLDLMEGRKPIGGKLEAKVRIREPLVNKSVEEIREKWLIIDEFIRIPTGGAQAKRLPRYN